MKDALAQFIQKVSGSIITQSPVASKWPKSFNEVLMNTRISLYALGYDPAEQRVLLERKQETPRWEWLHKLKADNGSLSNYLPNGRYGITIITRRGYLKTSDLMYWFDGQRFMLLSELNDDRYRTRKLVRVAFNRHVVYMPHDEMVIGDFFTLLEVVLLDMQESKSLPYAGGILQQHILTQADLRINDHWFPVDKHVIHSYRDRVKKISMFLMPRGLIIHP